MAETMTKDQEQFMRTQGKKILDLLVKIAPIPKGAKETYQVARETIKALEMTERTVDLEMGRLSASDDNLNRLALIAERLSNELSSLNRHDENWWLETSGANLFSKVDSTAALTRLQHQREHLLALSEACAGLKTLAALVFAQSVSNVKGLAKLYIPSIPVIDGYVTKDIRETFDVCRNLTEAIRKKLETAIRVTADMTKSLDRFLTLTNTQDHRTTVVNDRNAATTRDSERIRNH
jgi:hypothetical protein